MVGGKRVGLSRDGVLLVLIVAVAQTSIAKLDMLASWKLVSCAPFIVPVTVSWIHVGKHEENRLHLHLQIDPEPTSNRARQGD